MSIFNIFSRKVSLTCDPKYKIYKLRIENGDDKRLFLFPHNHLDEVYKTIKPLTADVMLTYRNEFHEILSGIKIPDWALKKVKKILEKERRAWAPERIIDYGFGPYGR